VIGAVVRASLAAGILIAVGCRTRSAEFYEAAHPCNLSDPSELCGTTSTGQPMTCFAASQLGGTDFCAPACDPADLAAVPPGFSCVRAGVLLRNCNPKNPNECPAGLSCFRTQLIGDTGLCMAMTVCSDDEPCRNRADGRNVCASSVLNRILPDASSSPLPVSTNSFQCLDDDCASGCPEGTTCLNAVYEIPPPLGDICVPNCGNQGHCPPTYSCTRSPIQDICVPGLPGTRCIDGRDCVVGFCMSTGVEFNICTFPCSEDADCSMLNSAGSDAFVCAHPPDGVPSYCATARPFKGLFCGGNDDCPSGQRCFDYSLSKPQGTCQVACDETPICPARGGLPHLCLSEVGVNRCSPGDFGKPCVGLDTPECIPPLACQTISRQPFGRNHDVARICTIPCAADADCEDEPSTIQTGFCGEDHFCHEAGPAGAACEVGAHCLSRRCIVRECAEDPIEHDE
jgi:hypothetical protein